MYQDYKIVVTTAAGRRRYMQLLVPFIVTCPIVDRYDIWIHTNNNADIEFFKRIAEKYPVINLVWQPDKKLNGNRTINPFYRNCIERDTIYFKVDDDIVWMEPGLIEKMVKFRIDNPKYFLVSPAVINNALSTYALQIENKLKLDAYYYSSASHPVLWNDGHFALELHQWFISKFLKTGRWEELHFGTKEMGMTRFSINAILWFGKDMASIDGLIEGDDEEYLSCILPTRMGRANAWNGDAIVAHFAFYTQRELLDKAHVLESYAEICHNAWENIPEMRTIDSDLQIILDDIQNNEKEIASRPMPYSVETSISASIPMKERILSHIPRNAVKFIVRFKHFIKGDDWELPEEIHIIN